MKNALIQFVEDQVVVKDFPKFRAGDTVTVTYKIVEGNKERLQKFQGVVLKRSGCGKTATFTVKADGVDDLVLTLTQEAFTDITVATCAEVNAKEDGSALFRVTGVITEIIMDKNDATKYNAYGNFYLEDETGSAYVYGIVPISTGEKAQDILTKREIKEGDVLTVVGPKGSYKGNPQMVNGYLVGVEAK